MRLGILSPARDEAQSLPAVLRGLHAALPGARLLVIDGHSRDETAAVARRAGATVLPQKGRGYADALSLGYRTLAGWGLDASIQLDADGQHPPAAAPALLHALADQDWVIGSRQGSGGALLRRAGSAALTLSVAALTRRRFRDVMSGYWACGPRAIALFAERLPRDVADANVRVLAHRAASVPWPASRWASTP